MNTPMPTHAGGPPHSPCPTPPLLTLEPDIIPPEAQDDYSDSLSSDPRTIEFDLLATGITRFDEPYAEGVRPPTARPPLQLETRGVTSHDDGTTHEHPVPEWQREFWAKQTIRKNTVAAKLREVGRDDLADTLEECHSWHTIAQCNNCGRVRRFPNRCDNFFCPECQPRLAAERRKAVEWWTALVCQPKHVVLTVRNIPNLTKGHVQEFKRWFARLRRRKFASNWRGGFYALEVTNEGEGWHLHLHALVDAKWIEASALAREWAAVNGGAGYIVNVKDARQDDYLQELCKYTVKGSQLAKWPAPDILTFITAFTGVRTFGVFGTLYAARTKYADYIASVTEARPLCDCGSRDLTYYTESQWLSHDLCPTPSTAPRPPSKSTRQLQFPSSVTDSQAHHAALAQ